MNLAAWPWANIINGVIAVGTGVTAAFTGRAAWLANKAIQNDSRPILVITPGTHDLEFVHKPTITVKNFGKGPAIIDEIVFFGTEPFGPKLEIRTTNRPYRLHIKDVLGPSTETTVSANNNTIQFFGEKAGVKFVVEYRDYAGNSYTHTCTWDEEYKRWNRTGD